MSGISRKISKSLISLLVTFLLLEIFVRVVNVEPYLYGDPSGKVYNLLTFLVPDPYLQWRGRRYMPTVEFDDKLNTRGFRAPEYDPEKPPGLRRVAVLGDSCSFGVVALGLGKFGMPRPYPALLGDLFDDDLGPGRVQVVNYGMIGYTSFHGLRVLKREALPDEPDFVVIRFGWNDHLASMLQRSYSVPRSRLLESAQDLFFKSRLLTLLSYRGMPQERRRENKIFWKPSSHPIVWVTPEAYELHLTRMIDIARDHGAGVILLDAPAAPITDHIRENKTFLVGTGYENLEQLLEAHAAYQAITERVAREKGVPFVRTAPPPGKEFDYFSEWDIAHPTASGHARIARALYPRLWDMLDGGDARGAP